MFHPNTKLTSKICISRSTPLSEMSTPIKHLSHPEHELILKEDDVIEEDATCRVCNKTVIGFPTYTCSAIHDVDDIGCNNFYLHRSCAELPTKLYPHDKHNQHLLTLKQRPDKYVCAVCENKLKFAYACVACDFDMCVSCAFPCPDDDAQRVLSHEGHQEHTLTLQRQALFKCDACWEEVKDFSYVCIPCDFWIHKKCAFSPPIIPEPAYHHHALLLTYSIPEIHRFFLRFCNICGELVHVHSWLYYCHKCTYFAHMKCATSTVFKLNENELAGNDNDPDLIEFPLHSEEALFDLFATQCSKFQVDFEGVRTDAITISNVIEEHWSHPNHPLQQLQFIINENDSADDDDDDDDDNTRVLLCDGCIQPISLASPSYYGCIECGFYLHSVCATKLPQELPVGVSSFHPQHSLALGKEDKFYEVVQCGVCGFNTNGFYYKCETCDIKIDLCCAFMPARIKHKSHKHHPLVHRPSSSSVCSVSKYIIEVGVEYACEICSNFQIYMIICVSGPSTIRHKYDDHAITLRYPPFFYEGAFYCETCEEPVNNQRPLFHCDDCDYSFHYHCICLQARMKLGGTIQLDINDQKHTLAFVFKRNVRSNSPLYFCSHCGYGHTHNFFFECDGCGYLICIECVSSEIEDD
ncbi:uncharacterized protein LOC141666898 [Apium graveolens]|uniref:uncharacterized protein LOC141666898 n=1 Tax=Apium graveolens TaxID=4045 RepID=UPI003D7BC283